MFKFLAPLIMLGSASLATSTVDAADASEEKPLWELGVGVGVLFAPDYPTSSERHVRGLGLPYIIYRGEVFRMGDGQNARAVAFENERLELDLSFSAAFDADSEDNENRSGMPDLDFMFQIGPQLTIKLADYAFADSSRSELKLALQARSVFSSDLSRIDQRGYVFEPMLQYKHYGFINPELEATVSLRPLWASEKLHAYFFDVGPEFVTPQRAAFEAKSGYFGTGLNFYGSYRVNEKGRLFFGIQTSSHHGAANSRSPLHEKDFTFGFGAGFIWLLLASEKPGKEF